MNRPNLNSRFLLLVLMAQACWALPEDPTLVRVDRCTLAARTPGALQLVAQGQNANGEFAEITRRAPAEYWIDPNPCRDVQGSGKRWSLHWLVYEATELPIIVGFVRVRYDEGGQVEEHDLLECKVAVDFDLKEQQFVIETPDVGDHYAVPVRFQGNQWFNYRVGLVPLFRPIRDEVITFVRNQGAFIVEEGPYDVLILDDRIDFALEPHDAVDHWVRQGAQCIWERDLRRIRAVVTD